MVIGQILLSQAFQPYLEQIAVYISTFVTSDRNLAQIVQKNLMGHVSIGWLLQRRYTLPTSRYYRFAFASLSPSPHHHISSPPYHHQPPCPPPHPHSLQSGRNRKTSIMFTLCLGYLIFAATMFSLQSDSLSQQLEWLYGADVSLEAPAFNLPLPEDKLRKFLATAMTNDTEPYQTFQIVEDFTFVTFPMNSFFPVASAFLRRFVAAIWRPSSESHLSSHPSSHSSPRPSSHPPPHPPPTGPHRFEVPGCEFTAWRETFSMLPWTNTFCRRRSVTRSIETTCQAGTLTL